MSPTKNSIFKKTDAHVKSAQSRYSQLKNKYDQSAQPKTSRMVNQGSLTPLQNYDSYGRVIIETDNMQPDSTEQQAYQSDFQQFVNDKSSSIELEK